MLGHGIKGGTQPRKKIIMRRVLRVGWVGGERAPSVKKLPITGCRSRISRESHRPDVRAERDDHPRTLEL